MIYGLDWGSYKTWNGLNEIPFADLKAAGLCDFFITQGNNDGSVPGLDTVANIKWAKKAGIGLVASIFWHFPSWEKGDQLRAFVGAWRREKDAGAEIAGLDQEKSEGMSSAAISQSAEYIIKGLQDETGLPVMDYTSRKYIHEAGPDCNRWIGGKGIIRHIAYWPDLFEKRTVDQQYLSSEEIKQYPKQGWEPALPDGWDDWHIWQFGTWQRPEGYGWPFDHQYDWNVYRGTLNELRALCGLPEVAEPTPEPAPTGDLQAQIDEIKAYLRTFKPFEG